MKDHRTISIADQIYDQLEVDILKGDYARGDILSESRLADSLGVSRTPVREALRRLEQEGYVEDTRRGLEVVGISISDLPDMCEVRNLLEPPAVAMAAKNITDDDLAKLSEIIEMQRFYLERQKKGGVDTSGNMRDLDSRFHGIIYACCGSKPFCDVLIPLHKKMTRFRALSLSREERAEVSIQEHEEIYGALSRRDAYLAEKLTLIHLVNARDNILTIREA